MEIKRILDKFDSLMEEKNFDEAERLLEYWIVECEQAEDKRNGFTLLNELVGFYRMRGERPQGMKTCQSLIDTVEEMGLADKVSGATAYINVATAYKSFNMADRALPLYEKAQAIYEKELEQTDPRLPALYNNMALTIMEYGKYLSASITDTSNKEDAPENLDNLVKAGEYFEIALKLLKNIEGSENEQAITYLNMADQAVLKLGNEDSESIIEEYVKKAYDLLEKSHNDRNPDFRMTAEKCISVIRHYGYFVYANNLQEYLNNHLQ